MTCIDIRKILNEFVDGELDAGRRRQLERHLVDCPGCRAEEQELRGLLEAAAALPPTTQPDRDLWPGIAAATKAESAAPVEPAGGWTAAPAWMTLPRLATAAVILVGLTIGITLLVVQPGREESHQVRNDPAAPRTRAVAMPADFRAAETEFQQATEMLAAVLERRRGELSPQTIALVEENVRIINQAIAAVQAAIASDPGNRDLGLLLTAMYRTKVDLMQRATRLPAAI
jgi:anti-sigma factor RsiW